MTQTSTHPFAGKLTQADAEEIRRRHAAGESLRELGLSFGVSAQAVHRVVLGQVHRSVPKQNAEVRANKNAPCQVAAGQGAEEPNSVLSRKYTRGPTPDR